MPKLIELEKKTIKTEKLNVHAYGNVKSRPYT
jgi:hypothetical protein